MKRKTIKNFTITIICQMLMLAFGLILPRQIVAKLGSESNGFLSTISEIFVYVSLLEGGLGLALHNSLYALIQSEDYKSITDVLSAVKTRYRSIACVYVLISALLSLVYPFFLKTNLAYTDMGLAIFCQGVGGACSLYYTSTITTYLSAKGKSYIREIVHVLIYVCMSATKIVALQFFDKIYCVSIVSLLFAIIEAFIYHLYFKKKEKKISLLSDTPRFDMLTEHSYFLVHQISSAIFSSTDLFVISMFCSLTDASIYAVYSLVFTALSTVLSAVFNSLKYILGNEYAKGINQYIKVHDLFDTLYLALTFSVYFTALLFANSFVSIYMMNMDVVYTDPYLPYLFASIKILSSSRNVCGNTHNIAHKAKQNIIPTILESIINLTVSIVLVQFIGIYGVLVGTIIALLFRTNQTILYTNLYILKRSAWKTYRTIIAYGALGITICSVLFQTSIMYIDGYISFCITGLITFTFVLLVYLFAAALLNNSVRSMLLQRLKGF